MSCYHPFLGVPDRETGRSEKSGNFKYKLLGPFDPELAKLIDPDAIKIPCGKCLGCRLDYSRQWADRMMLELDHTGKAIFVTLTYNNDHVPISYDEDTGEALGMTLCKRDGQLFFKRLRRHFGDKEIRFYSCGEYGKTTQRPHMHAIIFGLGLDDFKDKRILDMNELGQYYYVSQEFTDIWSNGFTTMSEVSYNTMCYVSRYVMKKAFQPFVLHECEPEYSLMSRRPGIGSFYFEDHPDLFDYDKIYKNGQSISIPKYFLDKLKVSDPDRYDEIKTQRCNNARDRELLKLQNTDLSYISQLEIEENELLKKTAILSELRR